MEFLQGVEYFRAAMFASWAWFAHIFDRAGAVGWLMGAIFTVLVYRFFLSPLIGGSGSSDQAKKSGKKAE